jgi:UTP:GlnB (protein PII) uridylyltransferase
MTTLTEIETAIKQLPKKEIKQLAQWIQDYADDIWDQQMETDLASGKLDQLIKKVEADITANKIIELDEIIYNA